MKFRPIDSVQFKQMIITFLPINIFSKFKLLQNVATLLHLKTIKFFKNIELSIFLNKLYSEKKSTLMGIEPGSFFPGHKFDKKP